MTMKHSKDWDLYTAKFVISELKEYAAAVYDWHIQKDDIEEVIMIMDSERNLHGWYGSLIREGLKQQWEALKEKASRELYLALIREEVEKTSNDKKLADQAI